MLKSLQEILNRNAKNAVQRPPIAINAEIVNGAYFVLPAVFQVRIVNIVPSAKEIEASALNVVTKASQLIILLMSIGEQYGKEKQFICKTQYQFHLL